MKLSGFQEINKSIKWKKSDISSLKDIQWMISSFMLYFEEIEWNFKTLILMFSFLKLKILKEKNLIKNMSLSDN
jgi:hypothetical protein